MLTTLLLGSLLGVSEPDSFTKWGLATLAKARSSFKRKDGLYREWLDKNEPSFNWGVGVLMSALNAAAAKDPTWRRELRDYIQATKVYWNPEGPVPGFDVLPMPKKADRYYDDNAWMVLALVEASTILNDPSIFKDAQLALEYVLSGKDGAFGGGIYWREQKKDSKNTCSNGPSAAACLAVYEKTKDPRLLAEATNLYAWTKSHLQDPSDLLFWDGVRLDGSVDKTKWTYNTALMIRTAADLARFTGEAKYWTDAEMMAAASERRWLRDGRFTDEGKFAFLLLDSWNLVPNSERSKSSREAISWLWHNGRSPDGWFGNRFDRSPTRGHRITLIDQAAAVRALLVIPGDD